MNDATFHPCEVDGVRLWLTRQTIGDYMLTCARPYIVAVRGTQHADAYVRAGDPIGLRHLCPGGVAAIIRGLPAGGLPLLTPARVRIGGVLIMEDERD
jgi:hypothetical protein